MFCPKDLKVCIDDLCYGSGCLECNGAPMLHKCGGCGNFISDEDNMNCTCEDYDEEEQYYDQRQP